MLELTTPAGTISASTEVELASRWAVLELGGDWDAACGPLIEHTTVWEYVEALELVGNGSLDGYALRAA